MPKIVLASTNAGKITEFQAMMASLDIELISQAELSIPDADETGTTFIENAIIKARQAAELSGLPAMADDSGLSVDSLGGAPGVYSARYAGPNASSEDRINKLLNELSDFNDEQRTARFHCVIALLEHKDDPAPLICHATWEGRILTTPQGDKGFGYDPVFYVPDHDCSAAELDLAEKNAISHRGKAIQQLIVQLQGKLEGIAS